MLLIYIEIALRNDDYTYDELNKALENAASNGWAMTSRVLISRGADINITLKYPKVHKELYQKW